MVNHACIWCRLLLGLVFLGDPSQHHWFHPDHNTSKITSSSVILEIPSEIRWFLFRRSPLRTSNDLQHLSKAFPSFFTFVVDEEMSDFGGKKTFTNPALHIAFSGTTKKLKMLNVEGTRTDFELRNFWDVADVAHPLGTRSSGKTRSEGVQRKWGTLRRQAVGFR